MDSRAYAEVIGHDAGIIGNPLIKAGTYEYDEICFISGEPVTLTGTVTMPTAPSSTATKYSVSYTYDLANATKNITLSRKTTFQVVVTKDSALDQTTQNYTLTKLDEKYTVGGVAYTLARYNYDQSTLVDNTPAVDYFNGNLYAERIFYKNGDAKSNDGILSIVSNSDTIVGYRHKWGTTETRVITQRLAYTPATKSSSSTSTAAAWTGSIRINMSTQNKKSFKFMTNNPQSISFKGSYIIMENQENVLKYTYDLPTGSGDTLSDATRNKGTKSVKKNVVISSTSLVSPKIKDIGGHWAEKDIFLLASLKVFDDYDRVGAVPGYYSPNVVCTRMSFVKAVARAIGDAKPLTQDEIIKRDRPGFVKTFIYQDVDPKTADAAYIEFLNDRHVMIGEGQYFYPDRPITRAEATAIMISALGLSDLAPQPPFKIGYKDEKSIPDWAKDYIYAAKEIGLVTAGADGNFRAGNLVTRADAAAMINKMINHIREQITVDYREKILN